MKQVEAVNKAGELMKMGFAVFVFKRNDSGCVHQDNGWFVWHNWALESSLSYCYRIGRLMQYVHPDVLHVDKEITDIFYELDVGTWMQSIGKMQ